MTTAAAKHYRAALRTLVREIEDAPELLYLNVPEGKDPIGDALKKAKRALRVRIEEYRT